MRDEARTKEQLLQQLAQTTRRLGELKEAEITCREAEATLKKERDFTSAVIDTAGALVVVLDPQGRIIRFNRACEKTTGYSSDDVRGRFFWDLFLVPEEIESVKEVFMELRSGRFPNRHENYWVTKSGDRRLISWSNTALLDVDGSVMYVIGTGIDTTELKALEREKSNLTSMFAHDMKSALTIIQGFVNRLINKAHDLSHVDQNQYFHIIMKEAARLEFLVDDFLEFTRLQTGKLDLNFAPIQLDSELADLIESYQAKSLQNGTEIIGENLDSLPTIEADANRLHRVFSNLIDNALKYSNGRGTIRIIGQERNNHVWIKIKDDGIGIDPRDLPYIFDPFHRGRNDGTYDGYGVGLAAVKTIVEGHGGKVLVESALGKGSTFTIILQKAKRCMGRGKT